MIARRKSPFLNQGIENAHSGLKERLRDNGARNRIRIKTMRAAEDDLNDGWTMKRKKYDFGRALLRPRRLPFALPWIRKVNAKKIMKEILARKKAAGLPEVLELLDAGAGHGNFLGKHKKYFKGKVVTTALVVRESPELRKNLSEGKVDRVITGNIETWLPKKRYDFIVSYMGGMYYSTEPGIALLKLAHALNGNGFLLFDSPSRSEKESFFHYLHSIEENKNFSVKRLTKGYLIRRLN